MMILSDAEIAELQRLADAATPDPWRCKDAPAAPFDGIFRVLGQDNPLPPGVTWQKDNRPTTAECAKFENALFIAAARQAIPSLLAEVRRNRSRTTTTRDATIEEAAALIERVARELLADKGFDSPSGKIAAGLVQQTCATIVTALRLLKGKPSLVPKPPTITIKPGSANDPDRDRCFRGMQLACAGVSIGAALAAHIDSLACVVAIAAADPANADHLLDNIGGDLRKAVADNWELVKGQLAFATREVGHG